MRPSHLALLVLLLPGGASALERRPSQQRPLVHSLRGGVHKEIHDSPSPVGGLANDVHNLFLTPHGDCGRSSSSSDTDSATTRLTTNVLAGLTCALAMVPEAVSFSFVAGVSPLVGLWTTVAMGGVVGLLGGRGGVMTGASGACAVVVATLC